MKLFFTIALLGTSLGAIAGAVPEFRQIPSSRMMKENSRPMAREADNSDLHELPLIETLPDGLEQEIYSRDSYFFARDGQGQMYTMRDYGMVSYIAVGEKDVYIKDPFAGWPTGSWIKGERDGDKVNVTFPQMVWIETYPDWENDPEGDQGLMITDYYYAYKFILQEGEDKSAFIIDSDNPTITFAFDGSSLKEEGDAFIGMVGEYMMYDKENNPYIGFNWMGFADGMLDFTAVKSEPLTLPTDLEFEKWILDNQGDMTFVDMAFKDSDVYLRGFIQTEDNEGNMFFPAIKGTLSGGQLTFSGSQYLGIDPRFGHLAYFVPSKFEAGEPGADEWEVENIYLPVSEITFDYDEAEKVFTCQEDEALVVSALPDRIFTVMALDAPMLRWQDMSIPLEPCEPTDLKYEYWDDYEFGALGFSLSPLSADGRLMDTSNLYYVIYVDGEEFTFYPDEYWDLEEPMTFVPYDYWDSYINAFGEEHEVLLFAQKIDSLGVKARYVNPDGTVKESDIAVFTVSGADKIMDSEGVRTEWYDLQGRRLNGAAEGLVIRRDICSDGSVVVRKVMNLN